MAMQLDFNKKRIFVADSTTPIGRRIAQEFHALGATVAINGVASDAVSRTMEELGGGPRLIAAPGDLSSPSEIGVVMPKAIESLSGIDVLVNSCGTAELRALTDVTEEYWEEMLALNVKGAFFTAQACVPALRKTTGCIINIASILGLNGARAGSVVYSAAQGASLQMTKMMALELVRYGITVNTLCLGRIEPRPASRPARGARETGQVEYPSFAYPFDRSGTVDDCVGAALYLAGPYARYTTGTTLVIDGGVSAGH
jgi:3-oxoacyl-[acyl-carrier protein] reductase